MKLSVWCYLVLAFCATQVRAVYIQNTDWTINPSEAGTSWATWSNVLTNGDIIAAGYVYTNAFALPRVMRVTQAGTCVFDRVYTPSLTPDHDVKALYIAQLANGHIFVGCDVDASNLNATEGSYLLSLNEDGDILSQAFVEAIPMRFSHNTAGQIMIAGNNFIQIREENGTLVRNRQLSSEGIALGVSINQTTNGHYLVSGRIGATSTSMHDGFLAKMDADLDPLWTQRYAATNGTKTIYCAVENPDGTITACGQEAGRKALLFKTDAEGNPLWTQTIDGYSENGGGLNTVVATPDNGSVAVGILYTYPYITSYDANGNERWASFPLYTSGMLRNVSSVSSNAYAIAGFTGFLGAQADGDWLTYQLTVNYDAPIVVNEILPFTPEMDGSHMPAEVGTPIAFSFDGYDPEGAPLFYSWRTNWMGSTTNAAYTFTPPPASAGQSISVALIVSDGQNDLQYMWNVDVTNRENVIRSLLPSDPSSGANTLQLEASSSTNFVYDGYDPDGNPLHYLWTLDEQPVSTNAAYTYSPAAGDAGTTHTLTLNIIVIPDVETIQYTWTIEVLSAPSIEAPYAVQSTTPWNGETDVSAGRQPTIAWTLTTDSTHPIQYTKVYFSTSQHDVSYFFPSTEVLNDGQTVFTNYTAPSALNNETTYYWRVVSVNDGGTTASEVFSFTTGVIPEAPYEPYATSPYDQSTGIWIDAAPLLRWSFSYDSSHPVDTCDVYLSTDANAITNLASSARVLTSSPLAYGSGAYSLSEPLHMGQTYYWRVVGHNTEGSTPGGIWVFTTETPLALPSEQTFESGMLPEGWKSFYNFESDGGLNGANLQVDWGGWNIVFDPTLVHSGSSAAGLQGGMPAFHWLISPIFQPTASSSVKAWLYHGTNEWQSTVAPLHALISVNGTWQILRTWTASDTTYYDAEVTLDLAAYAGQTVRIAWVYDLSNSGAPVALDDLQITGASATDSDNDGLLDAWEIDHFGDLSHTADGDDDGDGTTNQAEYIAGTDPADATSVFHVLSAQPTTKSTVLLRWTAVSGRLYNIYWTSDLTQGFSCIATGVESPQGTYTHTFKSAPSSGYYKITVQAPE